MSIENMSIAKNVIITKPISKITQKSGNKFSENGKNEIICVFIVISIFNERKRLIQKKLRKPVHLNITDLKDSGSRESVTLIIIKLPVINQ